MRSPIKLLAPAVTLFLCAACATSGVGVMSSTADPYSPRASNLLPVDMKTTGPLKGLPNYGAPVPIPGSDIWISSFVMGRRNTFWRDKDTFSEGGWAASGASRSGYSKTAWLQKIPVRWHNALLVDRGTGEEWNLLDQRAYISQWWLLLSGTEESGIQTDAMVFAVTMSDTNGDGQLDNEDAAVAIMTDREGRDRRIVTPMDQQLNAVHYYPDQGKLLFELRSDDNQDNKFEDTDTLTMHFIDRSDSSATLHPWTTPKAAAALEGMYR